MPVPAENVLLQCLKRLAYRHRKDTGKSYRLTSGQESDEYVDVKTALLAAADRRVLSSCVRYWLGRSEPHAVAGMELGGALLAMSVSHTLLLPCLVVRKDGRSHGVTENGVEGISLLGGERSRVVLVEDVLTTGGSMLAALDRLSYFPYVKVTHAVAVVDREQGGIEAVRKKYPSLKVGALVTLTQVRETVLTN